MQARKCLRGVHALVFVLFGMIGSASATSANTDVTDTWWNPNESGWGMQMVNTGTFVFATIYAYGANSSPTWFTGQLSTTAAAPFTFSGPLYATTGPAFGAFFNPGAITQRQVGTMTFVLTTINAGQLNYSVDGVVVNKSVERTPLTLDYYGGNTYRGVGMETLSNCFDASGNGAFYSPMEINVTQTGNQMSQVWTESTITCTFNGTYSQLGRLGTFTATFSCSRGDVGTLTMFEMSNAPYRFTARFSLTNNANGCHSNGHMVGVQPAGSGSVPSNPLFGRADR